MTTTGDPGVAPLTGLLGIALEGANTPACLTCSPAPDGAPQVNFCAEKNFSGLLAIGYLPNGRTCS
ncbi:hydrophobin family protein [Streptomyces sp. SL13]|uniref:Hydrophobin family protein n=1 Tax=Streptantibioticus silvisoli TaxID=2705255 RepID=A0AA90H811_9ACTN|nr:hydrophobin family protein [Streptantibioticus silvisoli]MDI5972700.1 hydrophobin family protein [Streptantibioticus silvisoli]